MSIRVPGAVRQRAEISTRVQGFGLLRVAMSTKLLWLIHTISNMMIQIVTPKKTSAQLQDLGPVMAIEVIAITSIEIIVIRSHEALIFRFHFVGCTQNVHVWEYPPDIDVYGQLEIFGDSVGLVARWDGKSSDAKREHRDDVFRCFGRDFKIKARLIGGIVS